MAYTGQKLKTKLYDVYTKDEVETAIQTSSTPTAVSDKVNTSTGFFDLPSGTTAERPTVVNSGYLRFNTTIQLPEYYDGSDWKAIDAPPVVASVTPTFVESSGGGTITFTVTGSSFSVGSIVKVVTSSGSELQANSTTRNSGVSLTAVFDESSFSNANEPYDIKVVNASGLSGVLEDQIYVNNIPVWNTAAGSLGTLFDSTRSSTFTVSASDPDGDTITYSVTSGNLPAGASLNSNTGVISGFSAVGSDTTSTFTVTATDPDGSSASRSFSITVKAPVIQVFTSVGTPTWTKPAGLNSIQVLAIGAGGGGGGSDGGSLGNGGAGGGGITGTVDVSSFSSLTVAVGGGGGGGGDQCDGVATASTGGTGGINGGGRGGNAGSTPCSGGGGGGGGFSGIYSGGTYLLIAGGGGGGGGSNEGSANDVVIYGGGSQPNGNTGSTSGGQGQNYSGDGGGWGGGGGGYWGGNGGSGSTPVQGGANYNNGSYTSNVTKYNGGNVAAGAGQGAAGNTSVGVASTFGYGNNYGGGGAPSSGTWSANGNQGVVFIKY